MLENRFDSRLSELEETFCGCSDFTVRAGAARGGRYAVIYIKGIVSRDYISYSVIKPVNESGPAALCETPAGVLGAASFSVPALPQDSASALVSGSAVLLCESGNRFCELIINAQEAPSRGISEPSSDVTVRGPKAGFTEDGESNLAQLRRYIRTPLFRSREFTAGSVSHTKIIMCHVEGRASKSAVDLLAAARSARAASPETFAPFGAVMIWELTYSSQYNVSFFTEVSFSDGRRAEKTRRTQIWDRRSGQRKVFYDFFLPGADLYVSQLINGVSGIRRTDRELFVLRPGAAEFFRREDDGYSAFAVPFEKIKAEGLLRTEEI